MSQDCLPHDLMVAKLEAYGLVKESLQLIGDRQQKAKIFSAYSDWANVIRGISQGSNGTFTFQYFY